MEIGEELSLAAAQCAAHGLFDAARWAAEQAASLGTTLHNISPDPRMLLALSLLVTQNYSLASDAAKEATAQGCPEGRFIELYALWLEGEVRRARTEPDEPVGVPLSNGYAPEVLAALQSGPLASLSGPEAFLLGLVHSALSQRTHARAALLHAVARMPCLLPAWEELMKVALSDHIAILQGQPKHWMADVFAAQYALRRHPEAAMPLFLSLVQRFPHSPYFAAQYAAALCAKRDLEAATRAFETLISAHPRRLQELHLYSDVLYVKEDRARLAWLARHALSTDSFRAETQCVLGNLHSLHWRHESAIACFQRALRLKPDWAAAWVLRGHEHVELKQTGLAVHAYRRSLASQEREYRAWYGLGQAYELLKVPSRSLHYYRRATLLQPHDARMWCAVASCLETLGAKREAVRAYARALESENTRDPLALARLAALNTELGNVEQAAHYHKRHLDRRDEEQDDSQPTLEALLYLANYCKNAAKYTDAATYCSRLLDYPGKEKEEAKALLREIHALQSEESADSM